MFTAAILFTSEFHEGAVYNEDEPAAELFGTMGKSMLTLFVMGTLLDDATYCTDGIRAADTPLMLLCFIIFVVLSSFMMQNMLVGILVEVMGNSAVGENMRAEETRSR